MPTWAFNLSVYAEHLAPPSSHLSPSLAAFLNTLPPFSHLNPTKRLPKLSPIQSLMIASTNFPHNSSSSTFPLTTPLQNKHHAPLQQPEAPTQVYAPPPPPPHVPLPHPPPTLQQTPPARFHNVVVEMRLLFEAAVKRMVEAGGDD
ncbi:hypothetical protein K432DRAFT_233146 [Lepidopterella palustris CBS 459.81]|uniref:Uncharacterized protein n=1 Tax=Lepidopterella palustris CBS 459.81 TaxID=1314670 RepID=A0A8E2EDP4_9PEZI|nr:hypothetical protein K432DRAFT_233146 [Lepidopterella palustris CBS 459.81]